MWGKGGDWSWGKGTSSGKGAGGSYGKAATPSAPAATPYSKPELKPGDWICPTCGDHQFARNWYCKMCARSGGEAGGYEDPGVGMEDMAAMMAMMMMMGGAGGYGKGSSKGVFGDTKQMVQVSGLQGKVAWQDLKDHMKQAGRVEYCSILTEDGTEWGKAKNQACVRFASPQEAAAAVQLMNGTPFKDIVLQVEPWPPGKPAA
mmetsp:Transcript_37974/g.81641  ORF Transcript_37974/g.81641 Transcript_37974/m.81641 type:complete len:203 (+) Transcript_37974:59-667(+)